MLLEIPIKFNYFLHLMVESKVFIDCISKFFQLMMHLLFRFKCFELPSNSFVLLYFSSSICVIGYRYSVEKIPVYDSAEDEPPSKVPRNLNSENSGSKFNGKTENSMDVIIKPEQLSDSLAFSIQPPDSASMKGLYLNSMTEIGTEDMKLYSRNTQQAFRESDPLISRIRSNSAGRNYRIRPGSISTKRSKTKKGKFKNIIQKQVDVKSAAESLASEDAREEILRYEVRPSSVQCYLLCGLWLLKIARV